MMGMRTSMLRLGQTLGPVSFTFLAEAGFATTTAGYRALLAASGAVVPGRRRRGVRAPPALNPGIGSVFGGQSTGGADDSSPRRAHR